MHERYTEIKNYVDANPLAVLSTLGDNGEPHGAVVYVYADSQQPVFYFLTKTGTQKYKDVTDRNSVSVTIFDDAQNSTLQASGQTFLVHDAATIDLVMEKMPELHAKAIEWLPPLSKLRAGPYAVLGIRLTKARLAKFKGEEIGSQYIFTEM